MVKLKIGKRVYNIDNKDIILDNSSCQMILTKKIGYGQYRHSVLTIGKTLFNKLKSKGMIYTNDKLKEISNNRYGSNAYTYYKFNIEKMIENGYGEAED